MSRTSQKHCHLFVMSLLGVLFTRFPPVASSPASSLSRPSASTTSLERTRLNPCSSSHWSGMSGCFATPTPHTGYEPKICAHINEEHTPINLPDSKQRRRQLMKEPRSTPTAQSMLMRETPRFSRQLGSASAEHEKNRDMQEAYNASPQSVHVTRTCWQTACHELPKTHGNSRTSPNDEREPISPQTSRQASTDVAFFTAQLTDSRLALSTRKKGSGHPKGS